MPQTIPHQLSVSLPIPVLNFGRLICRDQTLSQGIHEALYWFHAYVRNEMKTVDDLNRKYDEYFEFLDGYPGYKHKNIAARISDGAQQYVVEPFKRLRRPQQLSSFLACAIFLGWSKLFNAYYPWFLLRSYFVGDDMIEINGEQISEHEAQSLIKMLLEDAKRMAGEFHTMNRSKKFRINWPDEYKFANSEWRNFVDATITLYGEQLGNPNINTVDKRRLHLAVVLWAQIGKVASKDNRLQLKPNTQQFEGDAYENKKIVETYGAAPNLRAALLNTTATRH